MLRCVAPKGVQGVDWVDAGGFIKTMRRRRGLYVVALCFGSVNGPSDRCRRPTGACVALT